MVNIKVVQHALKELNGLKYCPPEYKGGIVETLERYPACKNVPHQDVVDSVDEAWRIWAGK